MKKPKTIKKILVIRFRRIGDAVLSSVICSSLRKSYPSAEIHYILNENIAPLFENHPDIDKIITFSDTENKNIGLYIQKAWRIMHSNHYELIIDCRSTVKTLLFSLFSMSSPYKLGIEKKYNFLSDYKICTTDHESSVDIMLSLLSPIEKELNLQLTNEFVIKITEKEQRDFKNYMIQEGIDFSKPIFVCTIASRNPKKIWNTDYMAEVLLCIIKRYDTQLIFNYVGDEFPVAQLVKEKMGNPSQVFLNIEAKSLRELGALLKNSDFLFGNEGGPRHISQALDIPSFAIYPPGISKKEWLPNPSERFQGIEPKDILSDSELENMNYIDAFNSITPDIIYEKLFLMMDIYFKTKLSVERVDISE